MRLVEKVRSAVNIRCQAERSKPNVIFVDRGRGFYNTGTGKITAGFKQALRDHGFKGIMGDDAAQQPASFGDVLLHETAVAWMRKRLEVTMPQNCWKETREEYSARLKRCCDHVNKDYDVEGLCRGFPKRLKTLDEKEGARLPR